jgi:lipopolysaccharide transport system ATP-binding protein
VSDTVIRVENLSKKYVISHQQEGNRRNKTLRDSITKGVESLGKRLFKPAGQQIYNPAREEFWALKDVSFEIKQGDRVGIIGRNGAGKSTLLKVLSRIVEPTSGKIGIKGRVASLLEVGTGFHPELTGRENIYLNGAILGMSKIEIQRNFDEIVKFAEVEKFLDTPVKRYSSGMYVRLAFAVAAHLESEILIVDEVLAVGDIAFQKKCIGKMNDVSTKGGRTVLFVSHNLGVMRELCTRGILLQKGKIIENTNFEKATHEYIVSGAEFNGYWKRPIDFINKRINFLEVSIKTASEEKSGHISSIESFYIDILFKVEQKINNFQIHVRITNQEGIPVLTTANIDFDEQEKSIDKGVYNYRISMPGSFFQPGIYSLIVASLIPKTELIEVIDGKVIFSIDDMGNHATILNDSRLGVVTPIFSWQKEILSSN